jgi:transposase
VIKDIRRATRRHFSAEEKIRIVLEGLRGEDSIANRRLQHRMQAT